MDRKEIIFIGIVIAVAIACAAIQQFGWPHGFLPNTFIDPLTQKEAEFDGVERLL